MYIYRMSIIKYFDWLLRVSIFIFCNISVWLCYILMRRYHRAIVTLVGVVSCRGRVKHILLVFFNEIKVANTESWNYMECNFLLGNHSQI